MNGLFFYDKLMEFYGILQEDTPARVPKMKEKGAADMAVITFKKSGRALLIKIDGEIDAESAKGLRRTIDIEYDEAGARDMVFDMSGVAFMDSSGIGMMIGRYKKVRPIGGKIKVFGAGMNVSRIIELSGLGQIIHVYKSEKKAMEG